VEATDGPETIFTWPSVEDITPGRTVGKCNTGRRNIDRMCIAEKVLSITANVPSGRPSRGTQSVTIRKGRRSLRAAGES
jgi:hypothetical protein